MKATDSTDFCVSCHTMTYLWEATKRSTHYQNDRGVRVGCPDCHVPHGVGNYLQVKMAALKDVYVEMTNPALTKEDYDNRRPRLAQKVRDEYLANDSAECRNCHVFENFTRPIKSHNRAQKTGVTCIKCHYNLVHGGEVPWVDVEEKNQKQESLAYAATGPLQGEGIGGSSAHGAEGKQ
jgi:nitrate/TMAO reductase-like tetraheme cytochrome c subunit